MNCTLGGMIGNNSCGATAQRTGKVVDNIAALEVLLYDGTRFWCGPTSDEEYARDRAPRRPAGTDLPAAAELRDAYAGQIKERYPDIPRRVSGYNLDSLLPEHGFDIAGLLVGSESTLVTVLPGEAEAGAGADPPVPGGPRLPQRREGGGRGAAHPRPAPSADRAGGPGPPAPQRPAHQAHERAGAGRPARRQRVPDGPVRRAQPRRGRPGRAEACSTPCTRPSTSPASRFYDDPAREDELWAVREAGLGATAHLPRPAGHLRGLGGLRRPPGTARRVSPRTYSSLRASSATATTRCPASTATSARAACTPASRSTSTPTEGVATYRRFMERAADLVVSYGGSLSGEHGDGQSRGELLVKMFGAELVGGVRRAEGDLRPGQHDEPRQGRAPRPGWTSTCGWAATGRRPPPQDLFFRYPDDGGSFAQAANRCVGVGKCRQHRQQGRRRHVPVLPGHPRGRAFNPRPRQAPVRDARRSRRLPGHGRLAQPRPSGTPWTCAWPARAARPTAPPTWTWPPTRPSSWPTTGRAASGGGPASDLALGWLPLTAPRRGPPAARPAVNTLTHTPLLHRLATLVAGAGEPRRCRCSRGETPAAVVRPPGPAAADGHRGTVLLWPDTFTNHFHPHVGQAAVEVLERAGWRVEIPAEPLCCGLTWISTGQLATGQADTPADRRDRWPPHVRAGGYVVGLEPSCTTVFRSDAAELFPDDQDVLRLRDHTLTLAELLTEHTPGYTPPAVRRRCSRRCTATSTRSSAGTPTRRCWRRRAPSRAPGDRLLRPRRQLRLPARPR